MSSTRVTAEIGVEIAHWLFSHTNTTAASSTAARLNASWRIPWFAAPSPKKQTVTPGLALDPQTVRGTDRDRRRPRDDRVGSQHALVDRGDVHAAAVAAAVAVLAAEDLGHHAGEIEALGDAMAVTAVRARDQVVRPELRADADGDRLHADVRVHGTVDQPLVEQPAGADLEGADPAHLEQQVLERLDGASAAAVMPPPAPHRDPRRGLPSPRRRGPRRPQPRRSCAERPTRGRRPPA